MYLLRYGVFKWHNQDWYFRATEKSVDPNDSVLECTMANSGSTHETKTNTETRNLQLPHKLGKNICEQVKTSWDPASKNRGHILQWIRIAIFSSRKELYDSTFFFFFSGHFPLIHRIFQPV